MDRLLLIRDRFPGRPSFDTAVSRALLRRASGGEIPESLRLYRPDAVVAFGRRDASSPGFPEAVRAAGGRGFASVVRLSGGRAAVFHEGTLAFARAVPHPHPAARTFARFEETADILASALRRLGVDARVGEVAGEYCPGGHSVNAGGRIKLAGIGQRLVAHAAHVGGVIVAGGSLRIRDVLVPVYAALGLDWEPATVGSVEDEADASWEEVERAVIDEFAARYALEEAPVDPATLALAEQLEVDHRAALPGTADRTIAFRSRTEPRGSRASISSVSAEASTNTKWSRPAE